MTTAWGRKELERGTTTRQLFADSCLRNGQVIDGAIFQLKNGLHQMGKLVTKIDHITINQKWKRSTKDVKVMRKREGGGGGGGGADASSDHHLFLHKLLLKLRKTTKKNNEPIFD